MTGKSRIGLIYENFYSTKHENLWVSNYPENPERFKHAFKRCEDLNLISRCVSIPPRKATKDEILLKHSQQYLDLVESTKLMSEDDLKHISTKYDAVYFNQFTYDAALFAAGASIVAVDKVLCKEEDSFDSVFALVRPPGHHAMFDEACGYCVFNNVAIATQYALNKFNLERILIVDWDIHHGQGTQYMFYDDPRVLYFSTHRYEFGNFWPNLRQSDYDFIGEGAGIGYNINIPFNETGLTNSDILTVFHQILIPIAYEYNPQLVIVSCGYDAVLGDPESKNFITPSCFAHLTNYMKLLSNKKLAMVFEGGYNLKSMPESFAWTLSCLLGDSCPDLGPLQPPHKSTRDVILNSIRVLKPFWKCFAYQNESDDLDLIDICLKTPKNIEFVTESNKPLYFDLNEFEKLTLEESLQFDLQLTDIMLNNVFVQPLNRTAICYDAVMCEHRIRNGSHPERPVRIQKIMEHLVKKKILPRCQVLETRVANLSEISLIHDCDYIKKVESYSDLSNYDLDNLEYSEMGSRSIYLTQSAYKCATMATGCTLQLIDEILLRRSCNGFAIVRPPGHHAEHDHEMGFCFFNSVAVGAKYALEKYKLERILIVDWDIHHGNGTQDAFIDDPRVLFISLHRYDNGYFYPRNSNNSLKFVGTGAGEGYNINIPWNESKHGDSEYLAAFQQIIMPVAYEFGPELVLVSAGFDAAIGDYLGGYTLSAEAYGHMTKMLMNLAAGKMALVLEGGYNITSVSESVCACVSVLLGDNPNELRTTRPNDNAIKTIMSVIQKHKKYWKNLAFDEYLPSDDLTLQWLEKQHGHIFTLRTAKLTPKKSTPTSKKKQSHNKRSPKTPAGLNYVSNVTASNNSDIKKDKTNSKKKKVPTATLR